jgi:hypothetical protein
MWGNIENRKKFFEKFAKENFFDPLIPENWYSQPKQIMDTKVSFIISSFGILFVIGRKDRKADKIILFDRVQEE